jgi:dipeptidyl aminopeptidase/acylaminoacyl peptidase
MKQLICSVLVICCWLTGRAQDSPQFRGGPGRVQGVYKDRIAPHWFAGNQCFWYRNDLSGNAKEFIRVDVDQGKRQPAFDHQKLAEALSKATGNAYQADKLPFSIIEFTEDNKAILFSAAEKVWKCDLAAYQVAQSNAKITTTEERPAFGRGGERGFGGWGRGPSASSPDGKKTAFIRDQNIFVRSKDPDKEVALSKDGAEGNAYSGQCSWSPDSAALIGWRVEPGERKEIHMVQSSPKGGGRAVLKKQPYALPGDKYPLAELNIFDVNGGRQIKPQIDRWTDADYGESRAPAVHWSKDGRYFTYLQKDRGHQRLRVVRVDARSGDISNVIDEKSRTFIWTAHTEEMNLAIVNWLEKTDEILYASEQDGWRHLFLSDVQQGKIVKQITKGEWVVRGIDRIDEEKREIWFTASGMNADQDPYFIHYFRVNFDGSGLVALTEGNGNHSVQFSPDRKYLIDTYSRVDAAPVSKLRRTSDGKLICALEEADIHELIASGWKPPEVFVAKGRDGKTDIWGIISRPKDLDPGKKYPVLESIYNGPQGAFVPKSFSAMRPFGSLTDLGFIVVQADAMGTAYRSKAFHDVCWHNLKDSGFPDRILWHRAIAAQYPYYDITRVGIYGTSAGGQSAAAAVLFHPEFYKAAVANSGCHDNRMDKSSWNEQWMGYPVAEQYSENSNIDNAAKLKGRLFLIVGELDTNVPPESTMRFINALIQAGKDFDQLVVPGADHGAGSPVTQRRLQDFFVHALQGKEPPDRNNAGQPAAAQRR